MIPSLNDQSITPEDWKSGKRVNMDWICDCCHKPGREVIIAPEGAPLTRPYQIIKPPTFVEVSGIRYHACGPECARILFSIHHQYAMRELAPEKRFVNLAGQFDAKRPYLLDLDTVVEMILEEWQPAMGTKDPSKGPSENDPMWIVWRTAEDPKLRYSPNTFSRAHGNEILEMWKARPARSLSVVPMARP